MDHKPHQRSVKNVALLSWINFPIFLLCAFETAPEHWKPFWKYIQNTQFMLGLVSFLVGSLVLCFSFVDWKLLNIAVQTNNTKRTIPLWQGTNQFKSTLMLVVIFLIMALLIREEGGSPHPIWRYLGMSVLWNSGCFQIALMHHIYVVHNKCRSTCGVAFGSFRNNDALSSSPRTITAIREDGKLFFVPSYIQVTS